MHLCHSCVQFVIRHDALGYFRFAALQSEVGQAVLRASGQLLPTPAGPESVALVADGQVYTYSAAVLRIIG